MRTAAKTGLRNLRAKREHLVLLPSKEKTFEGLALVEASQGQKRKLTAS
jgi:hypothetical protein